MSERFACFASFHNDRPRLLPRPRDSRQSWRTDIPGCGGSFIVISLPPPWSMVIDQINLKSVAPIEAEYDPPGARDPLATHLLDVWRVGCRCRSVSHALHLFTMIARGFFRARATPGNHGAPTSRGAAVLSSSFHYPRRGQW